MQDRTWTLRLANGSTYKGLSRRDALLALTRLTYGSEPVEQLDADLAGAAVEEYETPLAA
jgi:hypothetical protein